MSNNDEASDPGKRRFVKTMFAVGSVATITGLGGIFKYLTPEGPKVPTSWPKVKVFNVNSMKVMQVYRFEYPLTDTPNNLVRLGSKWQPENGVGPNKDVVAFSAICQHLGCFYGFQPPGTSPPCNSSYVAKFPMGYCCCHGSQYDFLEKAKVIGGPAPFPLPQVLLEVDSNLDIYALAMTPPNIFGHGPGRYDGTSTPQLLYYDFSGGTPVTDATVGTTALA